MGKRKKKKGGSSAELPIHYASSSKSQSADPFTDEGSDSLGYKLGETTKTVYRSKPVKSLKKLIGAALKSPGKAVATGLGTVAAAPFHIIGDLLKMIGYGGRALPAKGREYLKAHAEGTNKKGVLVPEDDLKRLLSYEPAGKREELRRLIANDPHEGRDVEVGSNQFASLMRHLYEGQGKKKKPLEIRISEAAAILFLGTAVFFFDKASITGLAVTAATGTSLGGYYSLIGFVFLGVTVLTLVYSTKRT